MKTNTIIHDTPWLNKKPNSLHYKNIVASYITATFLKTMQMFLLCTFLITLKKQFQVVESVIKHDSAAVPTCLNTQSFQVIF